MRNHKIEKGLWQKDECDVIVAGLCKKYAIDIEQHHFEIAHRLGKKSKDAPIIARLLNNRDKMKILKQKQKFRDDGVLVLEDFPPEIVRRRRIFSTVLAAAYNLPEKYKAFLSVDKLVLNVKAYNHNDLDKLPLELRPSTLTTVTKENITAFYSCFSALSNHYSCKFTTGEGDFTSVEQYYMYQKANHFGDEDSAVAIRSTDDPVNEKSIGKNIKGFKAGEWKEVREQYMQVGISAKFEQNPDFAKVLKGTGNSMLVEANPFDPFWGAGVSLASTDLWNPTKWKGANKLGRMLVELRDSL